MKKRIIRFICVAALGIWMAGCSSNTGAQTDTEQTAAEDTQSISGSITMTGSTSMEKYASAMNEAFMMAYPDVTAEAQYTGSGAGIEAVAAGTVDIGNSSRALKEEEKQNGVVENIVAIDGIGIITDKQNTVTNLTTEDISKIYKGEVENWSELGGPDQAIVVIGREAGSGTRGAFEEIVAVEGQCQYAQEIDSTGAVMAKVASTPGAIGYVSLDVIDDTVNTLSINGVVPTTQTIQDGSYTLTRPFVMATKGEIAQQSLAVQAYFDFIYSEAGQAVIEQVGLTSAK